MVRTSGLVHVEIKLFFSLSFRKIPVNICYFIFQCINDCHYGLKKYRTFVFHNSQFLVFFSFYGPHDLRHTVAVFRFCGSSHSADGRNRNLELCSLWQRQELVRSLIIAQGLKLFQSPFLIASMKDTR